MNKNTRIINEFLDYKEHARQCSIHTIRAYKNDLIQYLNFLLKDNIDILESQSKHIQCFLNDIGKSKISNKSMARKLASIKSFYKYLSNNRLINVNIAKVIKSPKIPKRLPNFLTIKEMKKLLNYLLYVLI